MLPAPTEPGQVGGHEGVGKIVKLGAGTESSGLKIGDRVGIKWVSSACGNCRMFHPSHPDASYLTPPQFLAKLDQTASALTSKYPGTTPQAHSSSTP